MICPVRMTRNTHHSRVKQAGGFTLLEVVFVLGLIAVLVTWLTLTISTVDTEQRLRESAGSIESLAKRARNIAVRQQRAYQLTITEDAISIAPQYVRSQEGGIQTDEEEEAEFRKKFEDILASEKTDNEVTYEVKRWGSDEWLRVEKDRKVVVTIDPTGLVEPISIRCTVGKSWLMQELHPLTAGVRDEEMNIVKE